MGTEAMRGVVAKSENKISGISASIEVICISMADIPNLGYKINGSFRILCWTAKSLYKMS